MNGTLDNYETDQWGEPDAGNFTYRIPLNVTQFSKAGRAWSKMIGLDAIGDRWINQNPKDVYNKNPTKYDIFRTTDNKGRIPGMSQFEHSASWRPFPSGPGEWESLEMRNGNSGGTKLQGEVYVGHELFKRVWIKTTVDVTPTEIKAAYETGENEDTVMDTLRETIDWASREALNEALNKHHEKMRERHGEDWDPYY